GRLSSHSNRFATAVVLSFVCCDCRKQLLRRGVGVVEGVDIVGIDCNRLVKVKDVGTQVNCDLESVRRRRGFRSISCECVQRLAESIRCFGEALASSIIPPRTSGACTTSFCARFCLVLPFRIRLTFSASIFSMSTSLLPRRSQISAER